MSFGQDKIFPRPAVEYIPLYLETLGQGEIKTGPVPTGLVIMETSAEAVARVKQFLGEDFSLQLPEEEGYLLVLASNLYVTLARYRGFVVTMVGEQRPGQFHLFRLTKKYFYKNKLFFEVYNVAAERLTWASYQLPAKSR